MRSRGVDDLGLVAGQRVDHGHRFARCVIVQAQDHQIDLGHQIALGGRVFAQLGRDADQFNLRHGLQAFADLQAGGTGFTIDKNFRHKNFQEQERKQT